MVTSVNQEKRMTNTTIEVVNGRSTPVVVETVIEAENSSRRSNNHAELDDDFSTNKRAILKKSAVSTMTAATTASEICTASSYGNGGYSSNNNNNSGNMDENDKFNDGNYYSKSMSSTKDRQLVSSLMERLMTATTTTTTSTTNRQSRASNTNLTIHTHSNYNNKALSVLLQHLPIICVLGDTSSGKSSLLSQLSGLELPSSHSITTKCPVLIQISYFHPTHSNNNNNNHQQQQQQAKISIQWKTTTPASASTPTFPLFPERLVLEKEWDSIAQIILQAQDCILQFRQTEVAHDMVLVRVQLPMKDEQATSSSELLLLDLPGLVQSKATHERHDFVQTVTELVHSFVNLPSPKDSINTQQLKQPPQPNRPCLFLAVLPANVDYHNSQVLSLLDTLNQQQQQNQYLTLGVLTKPDLIDPGSESMAVDILLGKTIQTFPLGFHMVKGRGQAALSPSTCSTTTVTETTTPPLSLSDVSPPSNASSTANDGEKNDDNNNESNNNHTEATAFATDIASTTTATVSTKRKVSLEQAVLDEATYFAHTEPWKGLANDVDSTTGLSLFGTVALREKLANLQATLLRNTLPTIRQLFYCEQAQLRLALQQLTGADDDAYVPLAFLTAADRRRQYQSLCHEFVHTLKASLTGKQGRQVKRRQIRPHPNSSINNNQHQSKGLSRALSSPLDDRSTSCSLPGTLQSTPSTFPSLSSSSYSAPEMKSLPTTTAATSTTNYCSRSNNKNVPSASSNETIPTGAVTAATSHTAGTPNKLSAAAALHSVMADFNSGIQQSSLATINTVMEGSHVLVSSPFTGHHRGGGGGNAGDEICGEVVHIDESNFCCVDYVLPDDAQSDVLFECVGLQYSPGVDEPIEENDVWSNGTKIYIARRGGKTYDSLRKLALSNVRTDPTWLKEKMARHRTDDLSCFLNVDVFKNIVAEFIDGDWKPHCTVLLDRTRHILMDAVNQSIQDVFLLSHASAPADPEQFQHTNHHENHYDHQEQRYAALCQLVDQQCHYAIQELLANATQQVWSQLEMEKHPYTSLGDDLCVAMAEARQARLKRQLYVSLRLEQEGVFDTQAIKDIVDGVLERCSQLKSVDDYMAEEMELILSSYGAVATKRVLDRIPMICWEVFRSMVRSVEESLWSVTDDCLEACMAESPEFLSKYQQLTDELNEVNKVIEVLESY